MLNRALRTEDMNTILDFRYFILDLYNQLYKVQTDFDRSSMTLPRAKSDRTLIVYHGQLISSKELSKLKRNIGGYIIINTFLSTTTSSEIALLYAGDGLQRPVYESVLFEIEYELQHRIDRKKPFADISHISQIKDENEVLFTAGTIFHVKSLKRFNDDLWILHLHLYNNENEEINEIEKSTKLILLLALHNQLSALSVTDKKETQQGVVTDLNKSKYKNLMINFKYRYLFYLIIIVVLYFYLRTGN
ncbi:unnamed protein product [Didymodactylos carnosus]|uniref:Uncharacterized protein n=1 Tax=Didymodactylos carnosus TaxID=1234261 RepID=A0A814RI72_9BILA|nr:unnamed protein product [Didymodactylos carnosus]CAF1132592.1 unnamed protein product [Didymodactylos carnosus]CAF3621782.1 unnamed protein product [Didymodactylos carnosus]CAF3896414.1 unnamed protein product [Didymodactylos carnosus]